jgi:DNA-binding transcriptional LysR family regulator
MDLNRLKAFVVVAHEGNLTRAALKLHLTQPAVSMQLKQLQADLGLELFIRGSHGLRLTRDGETLLPLAERTLASAGDIDRVALSLHQQIRGRLRVGTILDPAFLRLGGFLKQLVETYPQIETGLRHGISGWVLEQIRSQELDVGFYIGDPEEPDARAPAVFNAVILTRFQYRVLAPAGWKDRVQGADWSKLAALPWLWTPPASVHHRLLSRLFDPLGVVPNKVAEVDQEPSMIELVKSGVGLCLARDAVALSEAHAHGLTIVEGMTVPTHLSFVTLAARRNEPAIAAAMQLVAQQWSA